jgi:hypothetical protein
VSFGAVVNTSFKSIHHAQAPPYEPRWPVVLTILAVILLLELLPGRIRLLPKWFPSVAAIVVLAPIAAVMLNGPRARWLRFERIITQLFVVTAGVANTANLGNLIQAMVTRSREISGQQLLASSIAVWVTNILTFSLLYWQIDRAGPEARVNNAGMRPDWLFPQEGARAEDVPPGWKASFVDYLWLGFSTATAFSATDVMPLTSRAKLLMLLESAISLATIVVVAARAINVIGN